MKYTLTLGAALFANWLLWSGHFDNPFLIGMGIASCGVSLWLSQRMKIVDEEGAPAQLGFRPFTQYAPWLIKEIVVSNIQVAKIILSAKMPLKRNIVMVTASQKSPLGRVIMANSITLTPGTVSMDLIGNKIKVHALSLEEAEEDMSGDMDRRITRLEQQGSRRPAQSRDRSSAKP
ncbi:Na+/H+ antiporter subunit E [Rubripirellula reticaptiva]|uniref:Putative monovalent cation/H+ antiporter subunit E n=1 Tax=Rubripirellula reticaptiva TaxID=2528013 RepID=A0A5C6EKI5_9BACT|nr:Na+/H+ antiporter subunit E [Rubripirellula reticaptiva]TWU48116.1 putative monovalent cation/H+ antiporter subunit E [Rubripirellula reticaptiva]